MPPKGFWGTLQETGVGQCGEKRVLRGPVCKLERFHAGTQRACISISPLDRWKTETFFFFFPMRWLNLQASPQACPNCLSSSIFSSPGKEVELS